MSNKVMIQRKDLYENTWYTLGEMAEMLCTGRSAIRAWVVRTYPTSYRAARAEALRAYKLAVTKPWLGQAECVVCGSEFECERQKHVTCSMKCRKTHNKRVSKAANPKQYAYLSHKAGAKQRGKEFNLTLEEWTTWWGSSFDKRGQGEGLCMARKGDTGPYELGNIYMTTCSQNISDYHKRVAHA